MSLVRNGPLELVTFDGDVTLYDDGMCLVPENPVIPKILQLMRRGSKIGIVTAAGYTEAKRYYERLFGLLNAIQTSDLPLDTKQNLIVMGGESNFCFKFDGNSPDMLRLVPREEWLLKEMLAWHEADIKELLDLAEASLKDTVRNFRMEALVVRKERAVGIIPKEGHKFCRETLEETVLIVQKILVSMVYPGCWSTILLTRFRISLKLAGGCHSVPSTVSAVYCLFKPCSEKLVLTSVMQVVMTSSLISETSLGAFWLASAYSEASREPRRCMSEINS